MNGIEINHDAAVIRRRKLPHIDVADKAIFITACLKGSIAASGLQRIRAYRDELNRCPCPPDLSAAEWEVRKHKLVFKLVDSLLDSASPINHLADDRLAEIVQNAFLYFAEERYHLYSFVVMPSHHHWLFLPKADWCDQFTKDQVNRKKWRTPREAISHSVQSYTGNQCNQLLGQTGAFWQTETFDHIARDEEEFFRIIDYIERNPVVAGLAARADEYRWSSAYLRSKLEIRPGEAIPKVA